MRAEEGDESVEEFADEAAEAKKELRESTETGEKVQRRSETHVTPSISCNRISSIGVVWLHADRYSTHVF